MTTAPSPELRPTPGQTVGPFFGYALPFARGGELVPPSHPGAVRLAGRVLDGAGRAVPDALLELWQAAPDGSVPQRSGSLVRDGATFTGWGRAETDGEGHYWFTTLLPGPTEPGRAPFFALTVFARGLLHHLSTRVFPPPAPGAPDPLTSDPLLSALPAERAATLLALPDADGVLRFDVHLQGERETVFLTPDRTADPS